MASSADHNGNRVIYSDGTPDPFEVTATYIVRQVTRQAQSTQDAAQNATATAIVQQATATQAAIDAAKP